MGYEYEIQSPDYGIPAVGGWISENGSYYVQINRNLEKHPIKTLPPFYHCRYESLGSAYGYEIKSPVAPLSIHKQIVKRYLFPNVDFRDRQNRHGGIHVSVSRNEFTKPHYKKVFYFLHKDMPRNFQVKLSHRTIYSLNSYARQTSLETQSDWYAYGCSGSWWGHHYAVINYENANRFEFRLFAARKHLLIPALEMADSLFSLAAQVEKVTMENWTKFVASKLKYADINDLVKKALA